MPALDALASLALEQKRDADAEALLHRTLSIREGSLGPMHADVAANLDRLGALYAGQKKYAEAAHDYERSLFIGMKVLGQDSPELVDKYQRLAEVYTALGRPVDAEPLAQQVVAARESEAVSSLNTLASIYAAKDNFVEAEALYRQSIGILDKHGVLTGKRAVSTAGANLDLLAQTAIDYVEVLKKMRRKAEAARLEARIRQITGKSLPAKKHAG